MTTIAVETESKIYFGESLDEVLPQIRDELGPDALIVRQREGIVGGIGGFFGRKCVEVEARPASPAVPSQSLPARTIIDAYDSLEPFEPLFAEARLDEPEGRADSRGSGERRPDPARPANDLMETMLAQSSPFATTLSSLLADESPPAPTSSAQLGATAPSVSAAVSVSPALEREIEMAAARPASSTRSLVDELAVLRDELIAAAVPVRLAGQIIAEARDALRPFDPDAPMRELVRRSLTRRIPVSATRGLRRRIAVIGPSGAGRTLVAASLCSAYVQSGRSVAAMSLEPVRQAMRLGELLADVEALFDIAHAPDLVTRAWPTFEESDVVIADLPPLLDAEDPARLTATVALLEAFRPDETHLVLPAATSVAHGQAILQALAPMKLPTRLIVSHSDDQRPAGVVVGLALAHRIPVSFLGCGSTVGHLRPADAAMLGQMVMP